MDAFQEVMTKLHKPKGLIRNTSLNSLSNLPTKVVRARTIAYALLLSALLATFGYLLSHRKSLDVVFIRPKNIPYSAMADKPNIIQNPIELRIQNLTFAPVDLNFEIPVEENARGVSLFLPQNAPLLEPGNRNTLFLIIRFPKEVLELGHSSTTILVTDQKTGKVERLEVPIVGPF